MAGWTERARVDFVNRTKPQVTSSAVPNSASVELWSGTERGSESNWTDKAPESRRAERFRRPADSRVAVVPGSPLKAATAAANPGADSDSNRSDTRCIPWTLAETSKEKKSLTLLPLGSKRRREWMPMGKAMLPGADATMAFTKAVSGVVKTRPEKSVVTMGAAQSVSMTVIVFGRASSGTRSAETVNPRSAVCLTEARNVELHFIVIGSGA